MSPTERCDALKRVLSILDNVEAFEFTIPADGAGGGGREALRLVRTVLARVLNSLEREKYLGAGWELPETGRVTSGRTQ